MAFGSPSPAGSEVTGAGMRADEGARREEGGSTLISLQLLSLKKQEPSAGEPPSAPCLGCGPALFCFHYHTLLCNLHKYRVIFYRVAQKIEGGKNGSLCCENEGACCLLIGTEDLPPRQHFGACVDRDLEDTYMDRVLFIAQGREDSSHRKWHLPTIAGHSAW